jgi:hypothetical protein
MAYKIYKAGAFLIIEDTNNDSLVELNSSNVQIKKEKTDVDSYNIIDENGQSVLKVSLDQISDVNGNAYTSSDFDVFRYEQVGAQNTTDVSAVKPKVYKALLTQTGTAAPTAIVLENTIGDIVWTRTNTGIYVATLADAFTENKTFISATCSYGGGDAPFIVAESLSTSTIDISTCDAGSAGAQLDDILSNASFMIEVYP